MLSALAATALDHRNAFGQEGLQKTPVLATAQAQTCPNVSWELYLASSMQLIEMGQHIQGF
jgi:hypothetical protein